MNRSDREYFSEDQPAMGIIPARVSTFYFENGWRVSNWGKSTVKINEKCRPATSEEIMKFEAEEDRLIASEKQRKEKERMEAERLEKIYGFDPRKVGTASRSEGM